MSRITPSTATDPRQLAADLRERINPAYADTIGTESYERRLCAEMIERLMIEAGPHDSLYARIAELESALNVLRDRVQDEYDRIYISGVLGK